MIGVPEGGQLLQVGLKRSWPEGHIPTIRGVLKKWRAKRAASIDAVGQTYYQAPVYQPVYFQPVYYPTYRPAYSVPRFSLRAC